MCVCLFVCVCVCVRARVCVAVSVGRQPHLRVPRRRPQAVRRQGDSTGFSQPRYVQFAAIFTGAWASLVPVNYTQFTHNLQRFSPVHMGVTGAWASGVRWRLIVVAAVAVIIIIIIATATTTTATTTVDVISSESFCFLRRFPKRRCGLQALRRAAVLQA